MSSMHYKIPNSSGQRKGRKHTQDSLSLERTEVYEPSAYDELEFNPSFSIYYKTVRGLLRGSVSRLQGKALHDYLWDHWMADRSPTEAVGGLV